MIFLSGRWIVRYDRVISLKTLYGKNVLNYVNTINVKKISAKHDTEIVTKINSNMKTNSRILPQISVNTYLKSTLIMWTQVRFNNKQYCSRLHRDLEFPNFDAFRKNEFQDVRKTTWGSGDEKIGYTYVISFFGLLCTSYAAKTEITHLITYMAPAADVLAMASIEVEIGKIAPGSCATYKWRGKPIFIKHRTPADIELEAKTPLATLRDPQTEAQRTINPEWLVVIGICTHLGCVPIPNSGDFPGGFYCPCHGSHYDNIGRARKGPAPLNLEVPPYKFMSDVLVFVG